MLFRSSQHLYLFFFIAALFLLLIAACGQIIPGASEADVIPPLILEAPSQEAFETSNAFDAAEIPARDLADLTRRFKHIADLPSMSQNDPAGYGIGSQELFWYKNHDNGETVQVKAVLAYQSDDLNLWFEEGERVSEKKLQESATVIEQQILPTNRAFFGQEKQPGIDGDDRLNILHLSDIGGRVAGYFSEADGFVSAVNPYSNERELLYIGLKRAPIGSEVYYHVVAHEMQHLIHSNWDRNEDTWLNEGLSELANTINGYPTTGIDQKYSDSPDVQLNDFSYEDELSGPHYGASFLLAAYFLERFGEEATRALVEHPENGIQSIQILLKELETGLTFEEFFADWLAANYLDGLDLEQGVFQYDNLEVPGMKPAIKVDYLPYVGSASVKQFGADLIDIRLDQPVTFEFTGTQQINLIDTQPHSGHYLWSTYPADGSDMMLTRSFDLSELESASLSYWMWYDLEEGWDYTYVAVSTDEGLTWQPLETGSSTKDDPQGNSLGPGYTGKSGGGQEPKWVQQTADLSPFVGQPILLRFETVTDDTIHNQGFALDDIAIPELGYLDDVESGTGDWQGTGFIRHANVLPQSFKVQLILIRDGVAEVKNLELDEDRHGNWLLPLDAPVEKAAIIISATTPVTSKPAAYAFRFKELSIALSPQ